MGRSLFQTVTGLEKSRSTTSRNMVSYDRHPNEIEQIYKILGGGGSLSEDQFTKLQTYTTRLKENAMIDPMTGLLNKAAFNSGLEELIAHNRRLEKDNKDISNLTLAYIDGNEFKSINDKYGHQVGDDIITALGNVMESTITRESDLLGRIGGDEFAAVFDNTSLEGGLFAAEKLRKAVEARVAIIEKGKKIIGVDLKNTVGEYKRINPVTVSIGIANYKETSSTLDDLKKHADKALYKSKQGGKTAVGIATKIGDGSAIIYQLPLKVA